MTSTIWFWL